MKIHVEYTGQLRAVMRREEDSLELPDGADWNVLFGAIAGSGSGDTEKLSIGENGEPEGVLFFVGDEQVDWANPPVLRGGARVTIMSAISGG